VKIGLTKREDLRVRRQGVFPGSSRELEGPQRELEGPAPRFSHVGPGDVDELRATE
jgi:hypothetical protein